MQESKIRLARPDYWILFFVLGLCLVGLMMVLSATSTLSLTISPLYYLTKQLFYLALGTGALIFAMNYDYKKYERYSAAALGLALFLLFLVFVPFLSHSAGGASRWIDLGVFQFQPSEVAKLCVIIYLAGALTAKASVITDFMKGVAHVMVFVGIIWGVIMIQPDLGTVLVIFRSSVLMLFLAGSAIAHLGSITLVAAIGVGVATIFAPYKMNRILAFLDPWKDSQGIGYHIIQSLIAVGSGGLFGLGLGASRQKFFYLPEQYTDFIFAIICEETGFLGAFTVILLFSGLIYRGLRIAGSAKDRFGSLLAGGIISCIGLEALLNIGVVTSAIPTTGIPLPFISYGGTSLIVMLYAIGIVLNISKQNPIIKRREAK